MTASTRSSGALAPAVDSLTAHASPVVRGAAIWALARLAPDRAAAQAQSRLLLEDDADVCDEWRLALNGAESVLP